MKIYYHHYNEKALYYPKRVHAAVEQQRRRVKLRNIWVRPIICTRAALTDLELATNVVSIEEEMMARVVVTFALILVMTAVPLGAKRADAQSLDTRCLKVVLLVPAGCLVQMLYTNVVRLLYRMELHPMVSSV